MDPLEPLLQPRSSVHTPGAGSRAGGPVRNPRLRVLTALAVSLALAGAAVTYSSVETGPVADAVAPTKSSVTVGPAAEAASHTEVHMGATAQATPPVPAAAVPPTAPAALPAAPPPARVPAAPPAAAPRAAPSTARARDGGTAGFSPAFDAAVDAILEANSEYAVGVALIHMKDGALRQYGDTTKFVAASTAKILAAAAYYHLVETGRASWTTPMGSSTSGDQIRQMLQQSNNDSWALILDAIGEQDLTSYAASLGISYDCTVNLLTPVETAKTLSLLYSGKLLNRQDTAQLLSYMQGTNYEDLIPAAVPPGIKVFHKYGLLSGNLHDASILVQGGKAYVFVVYTLDQSGTDMATSTRIIHDLTRTVVEKLF